ncbi:MAG: type II toxin-antitoxin system Phd/YefM family antitoxin [Betaproteobacteria bacterium]|jgi:Antitoxin Phd_YefM, type II toxin-antitoxin system
MRLTTFSSREFNQDSSKAKKAAMLGPVVITDRGLPSHVLLTYEEFNRISRPSQSLSDLLALDDDGKDTFKPVRVEDKTTYVKF